MKKITLIHPHRKKHFEFFNNMEQPHVSICANVEIPALLHFIKARQLSFTPVMVYVLTRVANEIPQFRRRIRGKEIVEHSSLQPSFTVATNIEEMFSFCTVEYLANFQTFYQRTLLKMEEMRQQPSFEDEEGRDDYVFLSALPWVAFTSVQHAMPQNPVDSVPRIVWGKYLETATTIQMPLSVQAHHALIDGIHIGRYFQRFQAYATQPELLLKEEPWSPQ